MFVINISTLLVLQKIGDYNLIFVISRYYDTEKLRGGEKFAKRFYEFYPRDAGKTYFIDFFRGYSIKNLVSKFFGKHEIINYGNKKFLRLGVFQIFKYLLTENPNKIYITTLEGYSIFFLLYKIFHPKIKVINIVHNQYQLDLSLEIKRVPFWTRIKIAFSERLIYKYSDLLVFPSHKAVIISKGYYKTRENKVRIIPHGVDEIFFHNSKKINKNQKLRIIYVGGSSRAVKGYNYLFHTVSTIDIPLSLNICGDISDNKEFFEQYDHLPRSVEKNIIGELTSNELSRLYSQNDIFVLPSMSETFGISGLEAMASGLCVIVTEESGISEVIDNGKNGFVISYGNIQEFKSVIKTLNENREILEKISIQAINTAKKFRWDTLIPQYLEL